MRRREEPQSKKLRIDKLKGRNISEEKDREHGGPEEVRRKAQIRGAHNRVERGGKGKEKAIYFQFVRVLYPPLVVPTEMK